MHYYKKSIIPLYLLLFALTLTACQDTVNRRGNAQWLYRADTCMASQPDSALYYLHQIDQTSALTDAEQAHYCLLMTQAMDKNDLPLKSDSLIQIAVNYYTRNGSVTNRAKALFYKGRVLEEQGDLAKATHLYKQVETIIHQVDDSYLIGLVYSYLGSLNRTDRCYAEALAYYEKALFYYGEVKKPELIASALQNMAKTHLYMEHTEKADSLFIETLSYVPYVDSAWQSDIYHNAGVYYWATQQPEKAEQAIKNALSRSIDSEDRLRSYAMLALIYTKLQKKEEADSLWQKASESENAYTQSLIYTSLLKEAVAERNFLKIEKYVPLHIQYADSINMLSHDRHILEIQAKYDRDLLIKQNAIHRLLLLTGASLLLLLLILLVYLYKKYKRYRYTKERELLKQQVVIEEMNDFRQKLLEELSNYHFIDKNGCILDSCYAKVVSHYSLYNPALVHFLRDVNLALTPYEILLCVFSYEHLPMELMEQTLGKTRGALNKAILRAKDKFMVVARKDGLQKIGSLGDFLRTKF